MLGFFGGLLLFLSGYIRLGTAIGSIRELPASIMVIGAMVMAIGIVAFIFGNRSYNDTGNGKK